MSRLFNGEFRRKPDQSLGGASRKLPREVLIQKAAEERQHRQEERRKNEAGIVIQSHFKKWFQRKRLRDDLRAQFDKLLADHMKKPKEESLNQLFQWILIFQEQNVDDSRLSQFSQQVLKSKDAVISNVIKDRFQWLYRVQRLLDMNTDKISNISKTCDPMSMSSTAIAIPLRLIEVFTNFETFKNQMKDENAAKSIISKIWTFLIEKSYFLKIRSLIESKVPEPFEESIKPPTPMAASLIELILQPLKQDYGNEQTIQVVVKHVFTQLIAGPFSAQIKFLIIPILKHENLDNLNPVHVVNCLIDQLTSCSTSSDKIGVSEKDKQKMVQDDKKPKMESSVCLTYSVLKLISHRINSLIKIEDKSNYLKLLKILLTESLSDAQNNQTMNDDVHDDEDDDYEMDMDNMDMDANIQTSYKNERWIISEILDIVNDHVHVQRLFNMFGADIFNWSDDVMINMSCIGYHMLSKHKLAVHEYRLLYTMAFNPKFLRHLWHYVISVSTPSVFGSPTPLIQVLSRGVPIAAVVWDHILPQLTLFCSLLDNLLPTLDDVEFYESSDNVSLLDRRSKESESEKSEDVEMVDAEEKDGAKDENADKKKMGADDKKKKVSMPFTLKELESMTLILRDACIGLIELAYQDTKITIKSDEYKRALKSVQEDDNVVCENIVNVSVWLHLFKSSVHLLRNLHNRDSRRTFVSCPNHWISKSVIIPVEKPTNFRSGIRQRQRYQQFVGIRRLNRQELEDGGPPMSTTEVRNVTILQEIPFVVPFKDRVKIFQALLAKDRFDVRGSGHHFLIAGSTIDVTIRRNYIYEDAFEKLSPDNEPNLKKPIRVQLINTIGLDEAGIDGGGIFREFLNELLKTCFDPNRGLFISSKDQLLYPNPSAVKIFARLEENSENSQNLGENSENLARTPNLSCEFMKHYYFIGRMLGKALYENMLVELPFATFFLAKILSPTMASNVDIHHLATLDPEMYKNLVFLKNYDGNLQDLNLNFTIVNSDLGDNEEVELKVGGKNIPVTDKNLTEYIHLMAGYRLNKQIRGHCTAFKNGMSNVIDLDWIRMFSPKELQELISGAPTPIDVSDLKANTKYGGGYDADHPVIKCFWRVIEKEFTDAQRKLLLKFVTSCSRAPLLGFKDLNPPFCIQFAGREERLPTSSTCMNLLKLPEYVEKETLKSKLLYAIESGVGFELS